MCKNKSTEYYKPQREKERKKFTYCILDTLILWYSFIHSVHTKHSHTHTYTNTHKHSLNHFVVYDDEVEKEVLLCFRCNNSMRFSCYFIREVAGYKIKRLWTQSILIDFENSTKLNILSFLSRKRKFSSNVFDSNCFNKFF